ncbi:glutathione S-transferase 1-like isoform X2 [Ostrea edulis]|nr:glutathione S-transferase 1-like isoform X2 [Ostrea edulis]
MLHIIGVEFEDIRLSHEEWETNRHTMPQRRLPVLEVGGITIPQSGAILRYLGREYGYYGKNNHESTRIDVISGAVDDMMYLLDRLFYVERVEQAKVVLKQEILSWRLEEFLNVMENTLTENDGGGGFFVGDQVSVADVVVYNIVDWMSDLFPDHLSTLPPKMTEFMQRFKDIPNVNKVLILK